MTELISFNWNRIQDSYLWALDRFPPEATEALILKPHDKGLFLTGLSLPFAAESDCSRAQTDDQFSAAGNLRNPVTLKMRLIKAVHQPAPYGLSVFMQLIKGPNLQSRVEPALQASLIYGND